MEKLAKDLLEASHSMSTSPRNKTDDLNVNLDRETPEMLERRREALNKLKTFLD